MSNYYFETKVNYSVEESVEKITEFLKPYGFGILTHIDVQKTLKEKIGAQVLPYRILGACNPNFAKHAISTEANIGLMLPCNIVVQEKADGTTMVATINPQETIKSIGNQELNPIADNVSEVMKSLIDSLKEVHV
ncbi:MAG TPA: DUF302 domain-containing protein [Lentimicrobium sp.]|nr:DUF302 domain-containing protein [Lentimicrobium sp.]